MVSPNTTAYPVLPINATNLQSNEANESPPGLTTKPSTVRDSTNPIQSTVVTDSETLTPPTGRLPSGPKLLAADQRAGMSPAENALHDTDQAVTTTTDTTVATGSETLSPPSDRLSSDMNTPHTANRRAGMSPAENALRDTDATMSTINLSNTWEGALERIKWVMDTLSPVAGVR